MGVGTLLAIAALSLNLAVSALHSLSRVALSPVDQLAADLRLICHPGALSQTGPAGSSEAPSEAPGPSGQCPICQALNPIAPAASDVAFIILPKPSRTTVVPSQDRLKARRLDGDIKIRGPPAAMTG